MKRAAILSALLVFAALCSASAEIVKKESPFKSGGRVEMQLGGGDYEIRAGSSDKIVVTASCGSGDGHPINVAVDTIGEFAKIKTSGPHSEFRVVIELPAETNLHIRLMAGEMTIERIIGNKDIESHAGDMNIYVGDPDSYRTVDASVGAGDLNAGPFNIYKGGLFRSFRQTRKGHYTLHAHLGAGDLTLR